MYGGVVNPDWTATQGFHVGRYFYDGIRLINCAAILILSKHIAFGSSWAPRNELSMAVSTEFVVCFTLLNTGTRRGGQIRHIWYDWLLSLVIQVLIISSGFFKVRWANIMFL
jgi:hypothetical protein